ncbi:hypothetical protein Nepgr_029702 [Nepenthes gracilis]|uniref:Uncharacterized protein n=1 Tax=Nepenthes gracilis TaxID=150966 RepID=A0AAD3TEV3_NEPGR|nr:hypothetical protein Nepgr_029702 [Nepenthes gracilis]
MLRRLMHLAQDWGIRSVVDVPFDGARSCPDRQCFMRHIGPDGCVGIPVALFGFDSAVACFRPICIG